MAKRQYKNDIIILLPFYSDKDFTPNNCVNSKDDICNEYIKILCENSEYECITDIASQLRRQCLGTFKLAYMDDNYSANKIDNELNCHIFLTSHDQTDLHILQLVIFDNPYSTTQILDQVSTDHIEIKVAENKFVNINKFMFEHYNIKRCGHARSIITLSNKPEEEKEFFAILAGEAFDSVHIKYKIDSQYIDEITKTNLAQYDFYELYATNSSVAYIVKDFSDVLTERIKVEAALIFICEIVVFQNSAINRTNSRIIDALKSGHKVKLRDIELLYKEFGKTIEFWQSRNFKYSLAHKLATHIYKAFKTDELLEDYYRNQNHLEHIVELRGIQVSEKESKILNILAILLAIIQIIPLVLNWIHEGSLDFRILLEQLRLITLPLLATLFITIIALYLGRKKRKKII